MALDAQAVRLNIGAGGVPLEGFEPIDIKNGRPAYPLDMPDESVDEIRASHVLEHFETAKVVDVLNEWVRTLRPGGRIRLAVPNLAWITEEYLRKGYDTSVLCAYLMGGQQDEHDFHKCAFDERRLRACMRAVGLDEIQPWKSEIRDCASLPVSLNLEGVKPIAREPVDVPKIIAVMSTGRLGFNDHGHCAHQVFSPRGISMEQAVGAYWEQCLERVICSAIAQGAEWICTLDYDTLFTGAIFEELCYLMAHHEEADAIMPFQIKRESHDPLAWFVDANGTKRDTIPLYEFERPLMKVETGHFGLTLLRVRAFEKMEHPWFQSRPNSDGMWEEHRVDADVNFWHKWKAAGNTLYLANRVSIGHLQLVATWPGVDFNPIHQYVSEFWKHGPPAETIR